MGFLHPEQELLDQLGVEKDPRGNVKSLAPYTTLRRGRFRGGRRAPRESLIVWAINEGRQCARMVDRYLAARRDGAAPGADGARRRGLAGHADADAGPEGPSAARRPGHRAPADRRACPAGTGRETDISNGMPTFCRHNRFLERCPICSRTLPGAPPKARPSREKRTGGAVSAAVSSGAGASMARA